MSWRKIFAVIRREYLERVRTKGFWIATALIPLFFLAYIGIQIVMSRKSGGERRIAVVDVSGHYFASLDKELKARVEKAEKDSPGERGSRWVLENHPLSGNLAVTKEALRKEVLQKKIDGFLVLDPADLDKDRMEYYSESVSEFVAMSQLERAVNHVVLKERIANRGLPGDLATELERRADLKPFKVTEKGVAEEKGAGIFTALIFMIILYSTFLMYGMQNMKGVIDEKTNRIVEVIIASVRPTELMLGKIIGIGLVGFTQYIIWALVAANLSVPAFAGLFLSRGMDVPAIPVSMIVYFVVFFVCGYFLYAALYTAIGAPFNTDQEAQQLAMIPMMFFVSVWAFFGALMNNPNGGVALFVSLFPLTAPLGMFLRTAISQPPGWQIALSIAILIASTVAIAWLAGRIYRVGILMYGKKPTIPEIFRWIRYRPGQAPQPEVRTAS